MKSIFCFFIFLLCCFSIANAQQKTLIWRTIDLKEGINQGYNAVGNELSSILIQGIRQKNIIAYSYSDILADFSKPMSLNEFESKIKIYYSDLGDSVRLNATEMSIIEVQEYRNPNNTFQIMAIAILKEDNNNKGLYRPLFTVSYAEIKKYLKKVYQKSLKNKTFEGLQAYWYDIYDNTLQISMIEAIEKRKFKSKINKIEPSNNSFVEEKPKPDSLLKSNILLPHYIRLGKKQLKTTLWETIDFRTFEQIRKGNVNYLSIDSLVDLRKNIAYNADTNNSFVQILYEAIKLKQIQPYFNETSTQNKGLGSKMSIEEFWQNTSYRNDDVNNGKPINPLDLIIEIKSHLISDLQRKLPRHRIDILSLVIPQGLIPDTELGSVIVASFRFEEVKKYFEKIYRSSKQQKAFWQNPDNPNEKITMSKALEMRKFDAQLFKYANPEDKDIFTIAYDLYGTATDKEKVKDILIFIEQYLKSEKTSDVEK